MAGCGVPYYGSGPHGPAAAMVFSLEEGCPLYAIVIGCGRAGSEIAARLCRAGHSVVVIDHEKQAFTRLPDDFSGTTIVGRAIDHEVLESAGIADADAVIATTYGDNSNLTVVQMAKHVYHVGRALARVKDPVRAAVFTKLGLETICSTCVVADAFWDALARTPEA